MKLHINSIKHRGNLCLAKLAKPENEEKYQCEKCEKYYKNKSGLWKHHKTCLNVTTTTTNNNGMLIDINNQQQLVNFLMKENTEFKQFMIEQNKQMVEIVKNSNQTNNLANNTINSNNTNSNNSFNINFFLNETCKNAMNIMDFVNQLKIDNNDLEETGRLGFAEGISKIFINGLKNIDINDRPLHCSNIKKETLYIKDGGEWNKETTDKVILTNAIKSVAHKNIRQITEWTKEHPEFNNCSSKQNDKYLQIVSESMCGLTKEDAIKNYSKIIKNIAKETVIDKIK
jgi:hypothetical protein